MDGAEVELQLKRCTSEPEIPNSPLTKSPVALERQKRGDFQRRLSSCSLPSPVISSRIGQIRLEECVDHVTRETNQERNMHSAFMMSTSMDGFCIGENKSPRHRSNSECVSSPVRPRCSASPSPTRRIYVSRRSSPCTLLPSTLATKRKREQRETSASCSPARMAGHDENRVGLSPPRKIQETAADRETVPHAPVAIRHGREHTGDSCATTGRLDGPSEQKKRKIRPPATLSTPSSMPVHSRQASLSLSCSSSDAETSMDADTSESLSSTWDHSSDANSSFEQRSCNKETGKEVSVYSTPRMVFQRESEPLKVGLGLKIEN